MNKEWKAATLAVQGGYEPGDGDPRVTPIVQSTTYRYDNTQSVADLFDLKRAGFFYSRLANPTVDVMEKKIAALEGGVAAVALSSGQTANTLAILNIAKAGDHVVASAALYGGTYIDTQMSMMSFEKTFGGFGRVTYAVIIPLFAFTTILAWSYYGEKSVDFLFRKAGDKARKIATTVFKVVYVLLVIVASLIDGELAWAISDTFNGLMALPNLIGVVLMSGLVVQISKNYFLRKKGYDIEPMLSAYPEQNEEFKADVKAEEEAAAQEAAEDDKESW